MKTDIKKYCIMALDTGVKGTVRYDRIGALLVAHYLNKRNPNERYAICAV